MNDNGQESAAGSQGAGKLAFLDAVFFAGPMCGESIQVPDGITKLVVPVGKGVAIYGWADRSARQGWVFEFRGYLPRQPVAGAGS